MDFLGSAPGNGFGRNGHLQEDEGGLLRKVFARGIVDELQGIRFIRRWFDIYVVSVRFNKGGLVLPDDPG
ncbi:MAG: hypothetical protein Q9163_004147 [Psora crenata]